MLKSKKLTIGLISTADPNSFGSMRAYAKTLIDSLARYQPELGLRLIELAPGDTSSAVGERLQTLALPWRAYAKRHPQPDLWHVLDGSRSYLSLLLGNAPIVITAHDLIPHLQSGGAFPDAPAVSFAARQLWKINAFTMRRAVLMVAVSNNTADDSQREFGVLPDHCRVAHLPLRSTLWAAAKSTSMVTREEGLVIHVGNNSFYKNRNQVLRLFAKINPVCARELVMLGAPPSVALRALVDALGLSGRMRWIIDPTDDVLVDWYRRASVLLFPSVYEGYGWPPLEAMSFGCPVVASDAGSLPEVVSDGGVCLPLRDESAWVDAMNAILASGKLRAELQQRGFRQAALFNPERYAEQMSEIYRTAVTRSL